MALGPSFPSKTPTYQVQQGPIKSVSSLQRNVRLEVKSPHVRNTNRKKKAQTCTKPSDLEAVKGNCSLEELVLLTGHV